MTGLYTKDTKGALFLFVIITRIIILNSGLLGKRQYSQTVNGLLNIISQSALIGQSLIIKIGVQTILNRQYLSEMCDKFK